MMQRSRAEKEEKARAEAQSRVEKLEAAPVYISANAGEDGRLFGSVTSSDVGRGIADQLGEEIDRHNIQLADPIRTLGSHSVDIDLHEGVHATVTVEVIAHQDEA
jgi:large subunit ribosomal protein L9